MMKKNYRMKIGNKIFQIRAVAVTTRTTNTKKKGKEKYYHHYLKKNSIAFINVTMCKKTKRDFYVLYPNKIFVPKKKTS